MGSRGRFGASPSGCPSEEVDFLNQRDSVRAVEGNKLLWIEVYKDRILGVRT